MKTLSKIIVLLAAMYCGQGYAGEVGMAFVGDVVVNGDIDQNAQGAEFTGTSDNSQDVYNKTKETLENSFAGFVDATLIDYETGKETEIVLVSDDLKGSAIVALAEDKILFIWRPAPN